MTTLKTDFLWNKKQGKGRLGGACPNRALRHTRGGPSSLESGRHGAGQPCRLMPSPTTGSCFLHG